MTSTSASFAPTAEQEEIVKGANSPESLMINAYAGCAKTTTLGLLGKKIKVPALALAFNKSIAQELSGKFGENFKTQTMNGFGYGALMRGLPEVPKWTLEGKKVGKLISEISKAWRMDLSGDEWEIARGLVGKAQLEGIIPKGQGEGLVPDDPEVWLDLADRAGWDGAVVGRLLELCRVALRENNDLVRKGVISFDDQIYYPTVFGLPFPKFPVMLIDEAQDLSGLQHEMLRAAMRPDGKLVVCGDPKQAIYGFRGARSESMAEMLGLRPAWQQRPLTLTFRCPKRVVERQQEHAPGFRAWEGNAEGRVERWDFEGASASANAPFGWDFKTLWGAKPWESASMAVLCRNNGPLLALAFKLLRGGTGVVMLGRDIGKGLITLCKKISKEDVPLERFIGLLTDWEQTERSMAEVMGHEEKVAGIVDRAECLRATAQGAGVRTSAGVIEALTKLFSREAGQITLSSIHKAKGLEWDLVLHLDPWRVPSKQARKAAAMGDGSALRQEWNLKYVAETRTKNVLIEARLEDFLDA